MPATHWIKPWRSALQSPPSIHRTRTSRAVFPGMALKMCVRRTICRCGFTLAAPLLEAWGGDTKHVQMDTDVGPMDAINAVSRWWNGEPLAGGPNKSEEQSADSRVRERKRGWGRQRHIRHDTMKTTNVY